MSGIVMLWVPVGVGGCSLGERKPVCAPVHWHCTVWYSCETSLALLDCRMHITKLPRQSALQPFPILTQDSLISSTMLQSQPLVWHAFGSTFQKLGLSDYTVARGCGEMP